MFVFKLLLNINDASFLQFSYCQGASECVKCWNCWRKLDVTVFERGDLTQFQDFD